MFLRGFENICCSFGSEKSVSSAGGGSVPLLYITDFIKFIDRMKIDEDTILVSMDVSSLYTNIPQKELVCQTYDKFHNNNTHYLREMLGLILKEISFHFNGEEYLQKKKHEPS